MIRATIRASSKGNADASLRGFAAAFDEIAQRLAQQQLAHTVLGAAAGFVGYDLKQGSFAFLPSGADWFLLGAFAAAVVGAIIFTPKILFRFGWL